EEPLALGTRFPIARRQCPRQGVFAQPRPRAELTKNTHCIAALSVSNAALYKGERWYGQDHTLILPSMQVSVLPPTQISLPSSSTWTRPARPRAVPWLAM